MLVSLSTQNEMSNYLSFAFFLSFSSKMLCMSWRSSKKSVLCSFLGLQYINVFTVESLIIPSFYVDKLKLLLPLSINIAAKVMESSELSISKSLL